MNHSSNEVKQLMARACTLAGRAGALHARGPGADVLRALLPALVNGTKEKNTYVRANSEIALRAVLRLPQDDTFHQVSRICFILKSPTCVLRVLKTTFPIFVAYFYIKKNYI